MREEAVERVCELLYEAAAVSETWPKALTALADATGGVNAHFAFWSARDSRAQYFASARPGQRAQVNGDSRLTADVFGSGSRLIRRPRWMPSLRSRAFAACWSTSARSRTRASPGGSPIRCQRCCC